MEVIKLKIIQEPMFIDKPYFIEMNNNGEEVRYQLRQAMNNKGFLKNYFVKVGDEDILQDILTMERDEFKNRVIEELRRIRFFNKKNKEHIMNEMTFIDLLKHKFLKLKIYILALLAITAFVVISIAPVLFFISVK